MITLDGDGQHDAASIPLLLAAAGGWSAPSSWAVGSTGRARCPRRAATRSGWPASSPAGRAGCRCATRSRAFASIPLALFDEVRTRRGGFVFETEILLAAAARGWAVQEVPVAALPRGAERSRFRPLRDGVAIGVFLARRVGARWAREGRLIGHDVLGVFDAQRMSSRHVAMLQAAVAYSDSPVRWSAAFVTAAARRAVARLGATWRATRGRGSVTAARGTLMAPVALPLLAAAGVAGDGTRRICSRRW